MTEGAPRRAIVTGAASGVGRACVAALRARSCRVAALDLEPVEVEAEHVGTCDVSDIDAVAAAVEEARAAFGGVDAVAHCAGVFPDQLVPLHALDPRVWHRTIAVNLTGAYAVARAILPALAETRGALVLTASIAAHQPRPGAAAYATAKAGVAALARAAAIEYAHRGVRVNSVSPGWIDTPMAAPVLERPAIRARIEQAIPVGRVATPDEVAATVVWLLSDESGYITGAEIAVDGGLGVAGFGAEADVTSAWRREGSEAD
jgi:NAD(P)-dependent dehydrogenase (short-subunit alcohol dehydrogenase family)